MQCEQHQDARLCTQPCSNDLCLSLDQLNKRDQRIVVFHLLYAADAHDYEESVASLASSVAAASHVDIPLDHPLFLQAQSIVARRAELDAQIDPFLVNWRPERLGACTRLILRLAVWEIANKIAPAPVIINEAIELSKLFAEADAYRFINGVLDEWAKAAGYVTGEAIAQVSDEDAAAEGYHA
jgi:N utilization substance protein B